MKVIFMGTPEFSVPALESLAQKHDVIAVYTQPPRPAGKGYQVKPSPVEERAQQLGIPVFHPVSLKKPEVQAEFQSLDADVAVVCAYGLILPAPILQAPKMGCINIHASLLPRWRGAAPIQRAIEAGDLETGITIMQMDIGLDTGDMLFKRALPITPKTTAGLLHDQLSKLGAELIIHVLDNPLRAEAQPEAGVTYADKILKSECLIDWKSFTAKQIERKIRAFNPHPGAYFFYKKERIKVFAGEVVVGEFSGKKPGDVLDEHLLVACAHGTALRLTVLQREGKKAMPIEAFLKGFTLEAGSSVAI
ncbi:MAG: methionyl-tRNA formyltransferase [Lactobacillales bacterium]|jgi:methionyl-tRNA formyltransferase|nr:methionyl-tRNA formyltransferase [Lactobacillales bacterium]